MRNAVQPERRQRGGRRGRWGRGRKRWQRGQPVGAEVPLEAAKLREGGEQAVREGEKRRMLLVLNNNIRNYRVGGGVTGG